MKQPTRKVCNTVKKKEKKVKVKDSKIPKTKSSIAKKREGLVKKRAIEKTKKHPQYGTSKLEEDFARDFLDKLNVKYQYQFEAKDIGRFFDFFVEDEGLLIEIDGDFWHANPEKYKEEDLKHHQKRARIIDEYKERWANLHGFPIIRFWESDIRKNPKKVMKELKERLYIEDTKSKLLENKNKRHNNKI